MKRGPIVAGVLLALLIAYLFFWPVDIEPLAWESPKLDPEVWNSNTPLTGATRVALADGEGPEDIDVDVDGRVYVGLAHGEIVRWAPDHSAPEVVANTGGRPLGLDWDSQGNLVIADAEKGLLRLDANGRLETLATSCGGRPLVFTDDLEVARDGTVYFSDASVRFPISKWKSDILESRPNGRLCRYRPGDQEGEELLRGLHFANGVALAEDESFVLVNETSRYRVQKFWLRGPRTGERQVLIENLPGFPDGISSGTS
ncbi:MAG: SMP-30/gluconolactonase/LRE family protein, partial [Myxococcota bacterium]